MLLYNEGLTDASIKMSDELGQLIRDSPWIELD